MGFADASVSMLRTMHRSLALAVFLVSFIIASGTSQTDAVSAASSRQNGAQGPASVDMTAMIGVANAERPDQTSVNEIIISRPDLPAQGTCDFSSGSLDTCY